MRGSEAASSIAQQIKLWQPRRRWFAVAGGGGPFAAMIVRHGEVLGKAGNCVTLDNDPTAHAEVGAIRQAAARIGDPHLY